MPTKRLKSEDLPRSGRGGSLGQECADLREALARTLQRRVQAVVAAGMTAGHFSGTGVHSLNQWFYMRLPDSCLFHKAMKIAKLPTRAEVASQSRTLCQQYICQRLNKLNLLSMKAELRGASAKRSDVALEIQMISGELEKMYPELYRSISKQINVTMISDIVIQNTFSALADQLYKSSITWAKVVALFCLAGAFAVDCVNQGNPNLVSTVVDSFSDAVSKHLADWIIQQGGWTDIIRAFRTSKEAQVVWPLSVCGAVIGFILTLGATLHL